MIKSGDECDSAPIDAGFTKIAYIRGPINPQNSIDRFIGYKKHWKNDLL
jgi:LacI family transcriptional regulator